MSDFSYRLLSQLIEFPCPQCGYVVETQLLDVHTQAYRRCRCCYTLIHLIDSGGSVHGAIEDVKNSLRGLFE